MGVENEEKQSTHRVVNITIEKQYSELNIIDCKQCVAFYDTINMCSLAAPLLVTLWEYSSQYSKNRYIM